MSFKPSLLTLGGLSTAIGTIAVGGPIGVGLVCGLIALAFALIAVLALTGTFAEGNRREAAQPSCLDETFRTGHSQVPPLKRTPIRRSNRDNHVGTTRCPRPVTRWRG